MLGRTASLGPMIIPTPNNFDEEWARESAEAAYDRQLAVLNRTMNTFFNSETSKGDPEGKVGEGPFQAFGVYSMLRGGSPNLMTDETAFMANTYSTGAVSPRRINNMSQEEKFVLVDFINQLKTKLNYGIIFIY